MHMKIEKILAEMAYFPALHLAFDAFGLWDYVLPFYNEDSSFISLADSPSLITAIADVGTGIPAAFPSSSFVLTGIKGMFFSLHKAGKCIITSLGLTSLATRTSFATPRSMALVTSLVPFFILPVFLAISTASNAFSTFSFEISEFRSILNLLVNHRFNICENYGFIKVIVLKKIKKNKI